MQLIDRDPSFCRDRFTRCASCGHEEAFANDWFQRWSCGQEVCPGCGVDCTQEAATRVAANPDDPALDDQVLPTVSWWHTSTHVDWPSANYDPVAALDVPTRQRMGERGLERWAQRQKTKALHVGTYEAAIHNMFRRRSGQSDRGRQFHLYRVHLNPDLKVMPGCGEELVDFMGDVPLIDACPPGTDATRYVNRHEDPGGISLALGRGAIQSVQSLPIPLSADLGRHGERDWLGPALDELVAAPAEPLPALGPDDWLTYLRRGRDSLLATTSRRREVQRDIRDHVLRGLPNGLPPSLRAGIGSVTAIDDDVTPRRWCEELAGITQLIVDPRAVIQAVAATDPRRVSRP